MAAMNSSGSISKASGQGTSGGLLLGFSDCVPKGAAGEVYVAPLHRLRGVHAVTNKMYWHFEPLAGTQFGSTDVITMNVLDEFQPIIWKSIQNYIAGSRLSDVLVWVHNPCATNADGDPTALPNVTAIEISVESAS